MAAKMVLGAKEKLSDGTEGRARQGRPPRTTHLLEKRVMLTHIAVRKHQNRKHQISAKKNNKIKTINESARINPRRSSNLPREFGIYRRRLFRLCPIVWKSSSAPEELRLDHQHEFDADYFLEGILWKSLRRRKPGPSTRTAGSIAATRCCIVDQNLSELALNILREVEKDIPGLTDTTMPRRLGPKHIGGKKTKSKSTRSIVLSRRWCWSARDLVWPSRSVALSRLRVYEGAGPAPSERICRRTGPLISASRSSVGSEKEKNKVTEATKKRDETKTAKKKS
ncbi:ribosomal protein S6 [Culex quinquefasciatus]|uniref:Ribosomal protein S6 n=1 Tax=Culex quinquefasciatus TaxID=7176 RepID=B0VZN5_CULQU|nr:ribosomal protein S6 [Culex quinquefasciatus]|eukprot:XP_001841919.1 ribosomal protein S6 [Culex quinquefasciatus]